MPSRWLEYHFGLGLQQPQITIRRLALRTTDLPADAVTPASLRHQLVTNPVALTFQRRDTYFTAPAPEYTFFYTVQGPLATTVDRAAIQVGSTLGNAGQIEAAARTFLTAQLGATWSVVQPAEETAVAADGTGLPSWVPANAPAQHWQSTGGSNDGCIGLLGLAIGVGFFMFFVVGWRPPTVLPIPAPPAPAVQVNPDTLTEEQRRMAEDKCYRGCQPAPKDYVCGGRMPLKAIEWLDGNRVYYLSTDQGYDTADAYPNHGVWWFCLEKNAREQGYSRAPS